MSGVAVPLSKLFSFRLQGSARVRVDLLRFWLQAVELSGCASQWEKCEHNNPCVWASGDPLLQSPKPLPFLSVLSRRVELGGGERRPCTPLACVLKNFHKAYNGDYGGKKLEPEVLKTLCEQIWPKLVPQWSIQGSFDPNIVALVYRRVSNDPRQYPYIDSWEALSQEKTQGIPYQLTASASQPAISQFPPPPPPVATPLNPNAQQYQPNHLVEVAEMEGWAG